MSEKHTPGALRLSCVEDRRIKKLVPIDSEDFSLLTVVKEGDTHFAAVFKDEDARRLVACWNACQGISTEELVDIANMGGMLGPHDDIVRIAGQRNEMGEALSELLNEVDGLIGESTGVAGLHLNGDVAPWSELEEGGRFERLSSMSKARAAIARVTGEQP